MSEDSHNKKDEHGAKAGFFNVLGNNIERGGWNVATTILEKVFRGGYFRKHTLMTKSGHPRAKSQVEEEMKLDNPFVVNKLKTRELWEIEMKWAEIMALKKEIEAYYEDLSHYTTAEKGRDEIKLLEYGTNFVPPTDTGEYIEYIPDKKASTKLDLDSGISVESVIQLVKHLEGKDGEKHFKKIKESVKKWIDDKLGLKALADRLVTDSDLNDFIKSLKYSRTYKRYSPLSVRPVSRVHFGGGKMICPPTSIEKNCILSNNERELSFKNLEEAYSAADTDSSQFKNIVLDNRNNREKFADWVRKCVGLRHLATLIEECDTEEQFVNLFPKGVKEYKEPEYIEELCYFGFFNHGQIIERLKAMRGLSEKIGVGSQTGITDTDKNNFLAAMDTFMRFFDQIREKQESFKNLLDNKDRGYVAIAEKLAPLWDRMFTENRSPKDLHFKHTYEITRPFKIPTGKRTERYAIKKKDSDQTETEEIISKEAYDNLGEEEKKNVKTVKYYEEGKIIFFEEEHPSFKREKEIDAGLDERGMPLEVYKHSDGNYYILTDYWFWKTAQNRWQLETIAGKFTKNQFHDIFNGRATIKGEFEFKDEEGHADCNISPLYNNGKGRMVKPGFHEKLDLLEAVSYLDTNWDAYRDDFRDGRFHPNSKTYIDYVKAAHRFDPISKTYKKWRSLIIPRIPITTKMIGWDHDPWKRKPVDQSKLPWDEQKVTKTFVMEYIKGKHGSHDDIGKLYKLEKDGKEKKDKKGNNIMLERAPSHMNPAFDRAALAIAEKEESHDNEDHHSEEHKTDENLADGNNYGKGWVHWGRMYYYEDTDGINKYSENPDPTIGTRGIAKYLFDRTIRMAFTREEAEKILLRGEQYDFGVRAQGQPMPKNMFGGSQELFRYGKHERKN